MMVLLSLGIAGTVLFVLIFLIDGATHPGYHPIRHAVSALALGARGWVQTTNFIISGLLIAASSVGLNQAPGSVWLAILVAVFGLLLVVSGVFPMDPMRGYPPGTPDTLRRRPARPTRSTTGPVRVYSWRYQPLQSLLDALDNHLRSLRN